MNVRTAKSPARLGAILACAALALAWLAPLHSLPAMAQTMHDVADPQGRFTMSVPTDWTARTVPYRGDKAFAVLAPRDADGIQAVVLVYVEPEVQRTSSEAVAKAAESDLQKLPDYVAVESGPTTVSGLAAYYCTFTRTRAGRGFYQMLVYVAHGLNVYIISGTTLNDRAHIDRDSPLMLKIIGTLRVSE
jgi:hypothetical protein